MKSWIFSRKKKIFVTLYMYLLSLLMNLYHTLAELKYYFLSLTDFKLLNGNVCNKERLHTAVGKTIMLECYSEHID